MKRRAYIFVNGILTLPGDAKDWNARAVTFSHLFGQDCVAEKFQYFCGPIGRVFGQRKRQKLLAALLHSYVHSGEFQLYVVCHSNGADVVLGALRQMGWPRVEELHLVSGACEADFWSNGLNQAIARGRIGRVVVYCGGKDIPLRLARTPFGEMLGYDGRFQWRNLFHPKNPLGLFGPRRMTDEARWRTRVCREPRFGHSTWWSAEHFGKTMNRILQKRAVSVN